MNEQSHKEEMSAAIRGDFQRLRERGVPVALAPQERREDDEPPVEGSSPAAPAESPAPRRGWLSRLAGR